MITTNSKEIKVTSFKLKISDWRKKRKTVETENIEFLQNLNFGNIYQRNIITFLCEMSKPTRITQNFAIPEARSLEKIFQK